MLSNRILLVEDEPHIAEPLILALNKEGLDPTRVGTISDAREAYKNNTFDLIISINTIHNLERSDCAKALKEISRVCKKNGHPRVQATGHWDTAAGSGRATKLLCDLSREG